MSVTPARPAARIAGLGVLAAFALSACSSGNNTPSAVATHSTAPGASAAATCATGSLSGQGSTFQQPIELQWIKDYAAKCPGAQVAYVGTGSGAGKAALGAGTADFGGTDSLPKPAEQANADKHCGGTAIVTPVTLGADVLTYNLQGVTKLQLSPETLAGIFQLTIVTWNDKAIATDNPGVTLPNIPIVPVHRNDKSGTTNIFSSWLTKTAPSWKLGSGDTLVWPAKEQSGKGSDGVVAGVRQTPGGITYTELSYAKLNSLPFADVKNQAGKFVTPAAASISAALATAKVDTTKGDLRVTPDYATADPAAYPASSPTYVFTCKTGNKSAALLKGYLTYALTDGRAVADQLGYAPLPDALQAQALAQVAALS
ncbi:MAG: phosphate ABC transporter substrate-binding protein PstS [Actinomycetota bacterium]|nr:phosphate ABC transporter substrate-binding protein PstS [Actinomycetota bacterium]